MSVVIQCNKCRTILEVDDGFRGGVCRCSECGTLLEVPMATRTSTRPASPIANAGTNAPRREATSAEEVRPSSGRNSVPEGARPSSAKRPPSQETLAAVEKVRPTSNPKPASKPVSEPRPNAAEIEAVRPSSAKRPPSKESLAALENVRPTSNPKPASKPATQPAPSPVNSPIAKRTVKVAPKPPTRKPGNQLAAIEEAVDVEIAEHHIPITKAEGINRTALMIAGAIFAGLVVIGLIVFIALMFSGNSNTPSGNGPGDNKNSNNKTGGTVIDVIVDTKGPNFLTIPIVGKRVIFSIDGSNANGDYFDLVLTSVYAAVTSQETNGQHAVVIWREGGIRREPASGFRGRNELHATRNALTDVRALGMSDAAICMTQTVSEPDVDQIFFVTAKYGLSTNLAVPVMQANTRKVRIDAIKLNSKDNDSPLQRLADEFKGKFLQLDRSSLQKISDSSYMR
ncbi:MAG: hypothetical protein WCJ97_00590 [Phycisphaerae bacterium]